MLIKTFRPDIKKIFWVLLINLVLAIAIVFFLCPGCFASIDHIIEIADDILYSFLLCVFLGGGNDAINKYLNAQVAWIEAPLKRLVLNVVLMFVYSFVISILIAYVMVNFVFERDFTGITWQHYLEFTYVPLGITAAIVTFQTSRGFLLSWREAAIEAERLKTESIASQYESLKSQVNPHFLFNSLNTLTALVYENPDTAAEFIRKLAGVYRYVLDTRNREVVSLQEEMAFLQSYIFLQKMRYEDNLVVDINLPEQRFATIMIPPLSLQLLLENAVKHNEISDEHPLHIQLYMEDESYIVVQNNLQKKNLHELSSGIGLSNIKSRYEYLSKKMITIISGPDAFVVKLPVLHLKS